MAKPNETAGVTESNGFRRMCAPDSLSLALFVAAIVPPLHHPLHTATAAPSVKLSGGRRVRGVAPGDRLAESPAFGVDRHRRGARLFVRRNALADGFPSVSSSRGAVARETEPGADK
jgi:hypothetical protein